MNLDYINHLFEAGIIKEKEKSAYTQRIKNYRLIVENYYKELQQKQIQKTKEQVEQVEQIETDKNINEGNNITPTNI